VGMTTRATTTQALTAHDVFTLLRVPSGPLALHAEQQRIIRAWDQLDASGRPAFDDLCLFWLKKTGKSTTAAGLTITELVAGTEHDREIILTASGLQQSIDVIFADAVRFIRRNAWLTRHVRILGHELVYRQTIIDPRTNGRHVEEHIVRSVPSRDARSIHGANPTLVVVDELWTQADYGVLEALAASPARAYSRKLLCSYAGLRSMAREGCPLWDYWQRAKAGTDPRLFASFIEGASGWQSVPWITARFIEGQRRQFAAVPSKFRRLWLNEWAAGDVDGFLSGEEIHDAKDPALDVEPDTLPAGVVCHGGLDLALNRDWAAFTATIIDAAGRLNVVAIRYWRGTRQRPVSLMDVEDQIVALADKFNLRRLTIDQWQAALMAERLRLRLPHVDIQTIAFTPALLDRFATSLKGLFSSRLIRIPASHSELIEQLENLRGTEQRRRDLVRFDSGKGTGAGAHDDLAVSLMLAAEGQEPSIGRAVLPPAFRECYRAQSVANFWPTQCYLLGGGFYPPGNDASCAACPGHRYVKQAYVDHVARGGERMPTRDYRRLFVQDNDYVGRMRSNAWADSVGL
jgi:hypothetical protein